MTKSKSNDCEHHKHKTPKCSRVEHPRDLPPVIDKNQKGLEDELSLGSNSESGISNTFPWSAPTPVSSPIPRRNNRLAVDQRVFASPRVVNLTYCLSPVKVRHLSIDSVTSTPKGKAPVPFRIDRSEVESLWGSIKRRALPRSDKHDKKTLSVTNIDGRREFCGIFGGNNGYMEGRGFSRFLKQVDSHINQVSNGSCNKEIEDPFATTTPAAPYSSTDLLGPYSNENRLPSTDDLRVGNLTDRESRSKVGDLDKRPSSRKESKKSLSFNGKGYLEREKEKEREKDNRDRHKEDGPMLNHTTSHNKNYFKPMGMRNNFLSGQHIPPSQRNVPPPSLNPMEKINREPDDLVAMGTNWNPPNNSHSVRSNGHRPSSYGNSGSNLSLPQNPSGSLAPVSGARKLGIGRTSVYGGHSMSSRQQHAKDSEPKYSDPLVGAPPTFQQRLAELAAIEAETIRWEKARKMKKKTKE